MLRRLSSCVTNQPQAASVTPLSLRNPLPTAFILTPICLAHTSRFGSQTFSHLYLAHQRGEPFALLGKGISLLPSLLSSKPEVELPKAWGWVRSWADLPVGGQRGRRAGPRERLLLISRGHRAEEHQPGAPAYLSVGTDTRAEQIAEKICTCIFNRQVATCFMVLLHNLLFESSESCQCS